MPDQVQSLGKFRGFLVTHNFPQVYFLALTFVDENF